MIATRHTVLITTFMGLISIGPLLPARAAERFTSAPVTGVLAAVQTAVPGEYKIGAGDVLQVTVWKEPEASVGTAVVRPDGKITLPLLKEVEVSGLTPAAVEHLITERLSPLIRDPDVTVVLTAINSKKVYVLGAVRKEGPVTLTSRMTVLQVLSEAGGLTEFARRKSIYVLRTDGSLSYRFGFNYDAVIKGLDLNQNIAVLPGDTVVVPQ